jgi:hypothetical protein
VHFTALVIIARSVDTKVTNVQKRRTSPETDKAVVANVTYVAKKAIEQLTAGPRTKIKIGVRNGGARKNKVRRQSTGTMMMTAMWNYS